MNELSAFVEQWGYAAIFIVVILGNIGLPVPEETILTLSGYLVWRGDLHLLPTLVAGIVSASAGDNLGYWAGQRLGEPALVRYGARIGLTARRVHNARRIVEKYGAAAVFVGRFLPGLRFAAGPVSGILGLRRRAFFLANIFGAAVYVPAMVAVGYSVGSGFGDVIERTASQYGGSLSLVLIFAAALVVIAILFRVSSHWLKRRDWRREGQNPANPR